MAVYCGDKNECCWQNSELLGAFAKLRKATISFVLCVCLSVRVEHLGSQWSDFREILHLSIFRKSTEKIQISLKSHSNNGYLTWISSVSLGNCRNSVSTKPRPLHCKSFTVYKPGGSSDYD
jgi:hypothetical protein